MNNIRNPDFFIGVVEDRMDPKMLGRVRVRVMGIHTWDKTQLPTEDLPWAYKIQPTTSGAISGIGHAPVGVMEGTWVAIQYIDPEQQMPFVVGTFGGIPQTKNPAIEEFELSASGESNVKEKKPASDSAPETQAETPKETVPPESPKNFDSVKNLTISEATIAKLKKSEAFKSCPYKDGVGVWTIGYGSTYNADGSKVTASTPCVTESQADSLLRLKVKNEFETAVKAAVKVPVTQSMYDSLVHLAYNVGGGGIRKFASESGLNSGDYQKAADHISDFRVNPGTATEKGLRNRRAQERTQFLQDGIPATDASKTEPTPESKKKEETQYKQENPEASDDEVVKNVYEIGYKLSTKEFDDPTVGFKDPNKKYPRKTHLDEPDTNRLARHEKIKETIVFLKEQARHTGVEKANGKGSWDQAEVPYNAKYPFNNVWQSESGHVFETDDTEGSERVHMYHRKGTYTEIDHNGTQVNRIVGDGFQILEKNGYIHVMGGLDVNVEGAKTLKVSDTLDVQVNGKTTINIHDSADINVANDINLTNGGNFNITTGGRVSWRSYGNMSFDAPRIDLNSGFSGSQETISAIGGSGISISNPTVTTRGGEIAGSYEVTDDDPAVAEEYKKKITLEGLATKEELEKKPEVKEEHKPKDNQKETKPVDCQNVDTNTLTGSEKLGKNFSLRDLTGGRKLKTQNGTNSNKAYCNLMSLAQNVLDPIKEKWSNMKINSGYRDSVPPGGSATSDHMTGQAVDISFPGLSREQLFERAKEIQAMVPHDQIILEFAGNGPGWIHIGHKADGGNRGQIFTMNNHVRVSPDTKTLVKI